MLRTLPAPSRGCTRYGRAARTAGFWRVRRRRSSRVRNPLEVRLPMPSELRNRADPDRSRGRSIGRRGAAGRRALAPPPGRDRRRRQTPAGSRCSSENYYLERALGPFTEIRRGSATDLLKRELAVLIFADAGPDLPAEEAAIEQMGRGRRAAAAFCRARIWPSREDQLLPVRLRHGGGRTIGGALSWEQPAKLAPFAPDSPFAGLAIPPDVTVSRQVLAEPDLDLAAKTWARLADGTPLVTAEKRGQGWIVLVHTTANADWSNLALSGPFCRDAAADRWR